MLNNIKNIIREEKIERAMAKLQIALEELEELGVDLINTETLSDRIYSVWYESDGKAYYAAQEIRGEK